MFCLFLMADTARPSLAVGPPSPSAPLSPLGHLRQLSDKVSSLSVSCGCRNRDLSALIQEFLKSLVPWVPEVPFTRLPCLSLHFSGCVPARLKVPLSPGLIQVHLQVPAVSLLACLLISLAHLPPNSFGCALPYLKVVNSFLQNFQAHQSFVSFFFHSEMSIFYHMYR